MCIVFVEGPREPRIVQERSCGDGPPLLMGMLAPSKDLACGLLDSVLLKWQSRGDNEHACIVEVEQVNANVEATGATAQLQRKQGILQLRFPGSSGARRAQLEQS